jgi:uncharacterized protein with PQ loop repeat
MTDWHLLVRGHGSGAAVLTSFSYGPQVRKALLRRSTADLSLNTLVALTAGLIAWIAYGAHNFRFHRRIGERNWRSTGGHGSRLQD